LVRTAAPHHHITAPRSAAFPFTWVALYHASPHHRITASPHHRTMICGFSFYLLQLVIFYLLTVAEQLFPPVSYEDIPLQNIVGITIELPPQCALSGFGNLAISPQFCDFPQVHPRHLSPAGKPLSWNIVPFLKPSIP
jgi:hypothetical protein